MNWRYLLTEFDGRISRQPFWMGFAVLTAAEIACHLAAREIEGGRLSAIVDLAFIYPEYALFIKRAHDRNMPPFIIGVFFALAFAMDFLIVLGAGEDSPVLLPLLVPYFALLLVFLVELGMRPGTPGDNRFGPDPLRPS